MDEKPIKDILLDIQRQLIPITELSVEIVTQAELQSYTENLYDQLVTLAYEGMDFLGQVQSGEVVSDEWIEKRDDLLNRARHLLLDAPNARP
ncbi:hypothetical protein [Tengunoibacter tsumagoiensis]|uniref:Uncharacterized protein n=1 Tax=Tengunoibacter tsumagoiensis TaxID=2014871 RepID=A0A401ZW21_9CHLR|nr:hypothetical protein [Tengunoibacter tsumagoiensis]GCE10970.1 hypothetical protein KTT_08290 [Tengunoibacter tsumagoiensis]